MKKITLLLFTLLISALGFSQNMILNGDFAGGTTNWGLDGGGTVVSGEAFFSTSSAVGDPWNTQLFQTPLSFTGGTQYTLTFKSRAVANRNITVAIQNPGPWTDQFRQNFALTTTMDTYTATFTATSTFATAQIAFMLGNLGSTDGVYFDDISLTISPCFNGVQDGTETGVDCGGTCAPCATFSAVPTTNAPTPTHLQANVASVFSDSYTSIATNLNPNWGQSGFATVNPTFTVTSGNNILAYTNFDYQGTLLTSTNLSDMEYLHVDVYSSANPGTTILKVSPISNGAGPAEVLVTINHVQGQWYSVDIPKSAFTGMTWASIHQMKFAANGSGSVTPANFYFDNIYFWKTAPDPAIDAKLSDLKVAGATISGFASGVESYTYEVLTGTTAIPQITSVTTSNSSATTVITQATAIPGSATVVVTSSNGTVTKTYTVNYLYYGPSTAAPTPPARLATDVVSIYSDAYTPIIFDNFDAGWCGGVASTEIQVAGNNTLQKNPGVICHGIEFPSNRLDLTAFTHIHFDFYITDTNLTGDVFNVKLVDFAGGSAQMSALEVNINGGSTPQLVGNQWVSVDVPITALGGVVANNLTRSNVAQFAITTAMVDRVLYDNIYFHKNTVLSSDSFTASKVKLYPNPTSNVLNIESLGTIQTISVYNVLGQEVINKALNSTSTSLDVSSLNSGIYVVKTVVDGVTSSTKFIKQ
jgi:hypothetical protein